MMINDSNFNIYNCTTLDANYQPMDDDRIQDSAYITLISESNVENGEINDEDYNGWKKTNESQRGLLIFHQDEEANPSPLCRWVQVTYVKNSPSTSSKVERVANYFYPKTSEVKVVNYIYLETEESVYNDVILFAPKDYLSLGDIHNIAQPKSKKGGIVAKAKAVDTKYFTPLKLQASSFIKGILRHPKY